MIRSRLRALVVAGISVTLAVPVSLFAAFVVMMGDYSDESKRPGWGADAAALFLCYAIPATIAVGAATLLAARSHRRAVLATGAGLSVLYLMIGLLAALAG